MGRHLNANTTRVLEFFWGGFIGTSSTTPLRRHTATLYGETVRVVLVRHTTYHRFGHAEFDKWA